MKKHKEGESDDELIEKYIASGHSQYFEPLVERYEKYAYIYAYSLLNDQFDAQDVVAESFIKAFTKINQYRLGSNFKNWFLKIVHNGCFDLLRKKKTMISLDDLENSESLYNDAALSYDNIDSLDFGEMKKHLECLPHELRGVVILRFYYDWDYKTICEFLKIPMGTLSSRLNRACSKLKKIMKEE
ncbi:RNA polymerase sigma factor [Acetobacterium tundrae]|uniref:Sigma-70 family RNA polymerase sigma factor n=1 Tax=Acetobacterium tundrae TaxID=132932 RepID=A0ABR6WJM6_9FIRM|nr:sigma-70 family RNA polymerase sigma factor [Acetobacterium tundrae]MBC3796636.1 sigma-70 family RNA polymerase sigma factor [Acetobacterium tundrae]